jgi:hypothetical protein
MQQTAVRISTRSVLGATVLLSVLAIFTATPGAAQESGARCKTTPIVNEAAGREPYALAVRSEQDRYFVLLPDPNGSGSWQVRCGPGLPLQAESRLGWIFTLTIEPQNQAVDAREHLQGIARKQQAGMSSQGLTVTAAAISQPPNEILEYTVSGKRPDGTPFESNNLWTMRQRRDGAALIMHVSVNQGAPETRERQLNGMRSLLNKTFAVVGDK